MAARGTAPTTRLDIAGEETAADPHPRLRGVRERGPVVWHETLERWLITTDQEVRGVLADYRRFSVEGTTQEELFGIEAFAAMDDRPRHDALRQAWAAAFRPQNLEGLRPAVQAIVDELLAPVLERLRSGEAVDLSREVCRPLPTRVIALMMGAPKEAVADIVRWSDAMAVGNPAYFSEEDARRARATREEGKAALADYLGRLIEERRRRPLDDLISVLVHSEVGRLSSDDQLMANVRQLLFGGNETTAKWLAHLFVTYGEQPDTRRELAADPSLIVAANEEVMRWQTVVGALVRRVRGGPVEVAGVAMADGDHVTCLSASANRDPARYPDPDRLDIHRPPQPNLGFGVGLHNCLGAPLARLEAELVVRSLLDAVPDFDVAAPYRYSYMPLRGPSPVVVALGSSHHPGTR
jgi:cytochrome P450